MRYWLFLLASVLVFSALNFAIWRNERILTHGKPLLMELAPADPRSLMQGDYMRLEFKAPQALGRTKIEPDAGYLVFAPDAEGIGQLARYDNGDALAAGEMRLRYHRTAWGSVSLQPDSFMFQEGHAELFDAARYGIFKHDAAGNALLIGLADENKRQIVAPIE